MRILHVGRDFAALRPCGLTLYSDGLMRAQAAAGHDVSYFFAGRQYPLLKGTRLKRWLSGTIAMYEVIGSPINFHWELGTRFPDLDLEEPATQGAFATTLREVQPDVVHVQELAGLPSSLLDQARAAGATVVASLHDYAPVCTTVRLLDAHDRRCYRAEISGECSCVQAQAPEGHRHLVDWTISWELRRAKAAVPVARPFDFTRVGPRVVDAARAVLSNGGSGSDSAAEPHPAATPGPPPDAYQHRRAVNLRRLSACDAVVAPSRRTADLYVALGLDDARLEVQRLTLPHLEELVPRRGPKTALPVRFATLGGAASPAKGSRLVADAVDILGEKGHDETAYRLLVFGGIDPEVEDRLAAHRAVELRGPYAPGELDDLLDESDVGVLPSTWEETHGFVGIEMLSKGLPVIGNALGGIPEYVIEGETGWLNQSATASELASLMIGAIDDVPGLERLRRSVRERRHRFVMPMADHVAEVDALYRRLLGARQA